MEKPEIFAGAAEYYSKYRPEYPKEFFDYIRKYFCLDGKGKLLDLGCGPGSIAIPFAGDFEQVVGVDPEPTMLDEARKKAEKENVRNASWIIGRAEDISSEIGPLRLTTMGRSFHWMRQAEVLQRVYALTENGGGLVISTEGGAAWKYVEGEEPWKKVYKNLVRKYLGPQRRAGEGVYTPPEILRQYLMNLLFADMNHGLIDSPGHRPQKQFWDFYIPPLLHSRKCLEMNFLHLKASYGKNSKN
jgi:ubiquinone/menaquinone biosynthesis C-methylase UbiE